jgi:Tubulin-tyrosine ligase family
MPPGSAEGSRGTMRRSARADDATPTVLLIYPESWLPFARKEWAPLSTAACEVGFRAVVAHWEALAAEDGAVTADECLVRRPGDAEIRIDADVAFSPDVVLTTWGVKWEHADLFEEIVVSSGSYHSECPLLAWLDRKRELELCLRNYEERTGISVSRPRTLISEEISTVATPGDELVIVKPSRSGKCRGIEIVPRSAVASLAREVAGGSRPPFVVQELVDDVFLYEGRRWDLRVQAMATSLAPLRHRVYREGVARTAAVASRPGSARLEEWLNGTSFREERHLPTEDLPATQMLRYVEREHVPLGDFWARVDDLVRHVFAAIALYAEESPSRIDRAFLFPGLDLIVARRGDRDYEVTLLELNSHPGLDWEPHISSRLAPYHRAWFGDLLALVNGEGR